MSLIAVPATATPLFAECHHQRPTAAGRNIHSPFFNNFINAVVANPSVTIWGCICAAGTRIEHHPAAHWYCKKPRLFACTAIKETSSDGSSDVNNMGDDGGNNTVNDKEEPTSLVDSQSPSIAENPTSSQADKLIDTPPSNIQNQPFNMDSLDLSETNKGESGTTSQESMEPFQENDDDIKLASGSPLPGIKKFADAVRIPKASIEILKDQVFGFDTFFVTSSEPYEGGVLFKGNMRGPAAKCYKKIAKRLEDKFGDQYRLFLLVNPEDDRPVAVVVPRQILQSEPTAVPEWFAAGAFGLVTIVTLLLRNVPALQSNLLSMFDNVTLLKDGLPGALVTLLILVVHEFSHLLVAKQIEVKLGTPYFVPSWQIGSFGSITRILSIVPNREGLLKLAAAGPLAGFALGFILLVLGFILPPSDGIGVVIDPAIFHESFLAGGLAKLFIGDILKEGSPISVNPLVLWAWAGLLINAINSVPAGELDGGRISFSLWGRKAAARISATTLALLAISSLSSDVAFYWALLIFFLQRGPISPLSDEITDPENKYLGIGILVLLIGLLVYLPFPFPFAPEGLNTVDF